MSLEHAIKPRDSVFLKNDDPGGMIASIKKRDEEAAKRLEAQLNRARIEHPSPPVPPASSGKSKPISFVQAVSEALERKADGE